MPRRNAEPQEGARPTSDAEAGQGRARLGGRKLRYWNSLSRAEQLRYLQEHPGSAFRRAPLKNADPEADPEAVAPAVPRMDPRTGLPRRAPTTNDRRAARDAVRDLAQPGATDPGSEQREGAGAVIEDGGADLVREGFGRHLLRNIIEGFHEGLSEAMNRAPASPAAPGGGGATDPQNGAPGAAPAADPQPQQGLTLKQKAAIGGGMLLCAGLLGVGLLAIHPSLAALAGEKIMAHFGPAYRRLTAALDDEGPSPEDGGDAGLDEFVAHVADYARNGDLPPNFMAQVRAAYGV